MTDIEQNENTNPWQMAEEGWAELIKATAKIQAAADAIKKTDCSIDGYNIERALNKHKPQLMEEHLNGLREHRQSQNDLLSNSQSKIQN
ncbi:MAG: hypothetical protein V1899_12330 [Planctomycetota bacterium]